MRTHTFKPLYFLGGVRKPMQARRERAKLYPDCNTSSGLDMELPSAPLCYPVMNMFVKLCLHEAYTLCILVILFLDSCFHRCEIDINASILIKRLLNSDPSYHALWIFLSKCILADIPLLCRSFSAVRLNRMNRQSRYTYVTCSVEKRMTSVTELIYWEWTQTCSSL